MLTINGKPAYVIFAGQYYAVLKLPKITADFGVAGGFKYIKSRKAFSTRYTMFSISKNYQVLTDKEIKDQGLM